MTNKKLIYILTSIILSIISILLVFFLISLNILNIFLLILVIIFIIGISLISILLILKSKNIGLIISIILIIIYNILAIYIGKTTNLLNNLNLEYKTYNYYIMVIDNKYKKLNDIKNIDLGYYDDNSEEMDVALKKLDKKIKPNKFKYDDIYTMYKELLDSNINAIMIEKTQLDILKENNNINMDNIEEIYKFKVHISLNYNIKDIDVINKPFNIYLSGIDTYGSISDVSRSDVNMIISVNPNTREILLTSIPRDYYVKLPGKNGYRDKLTHASLYGTDMAIKALEDLFDININYYAKVNFSSVIDIIDAIGGIKVYSDYKFTSLDNYKYVKGYNNLNGEEALSFVRERKAFIEGDRQRVKNQQAVFKAIIDKCMSRSIILKYTKLIDILSENIVTNMPVDRITSLVKMQIKNNYSWNIVTNSLSGIDSSNYTYSSPKYKSYVMLPNGDSVEYASNLINDLFLGKGIDNTIMVNSSPQLKASLIRSNITLIKGEEYIYHGVKATYDNKDITKDNDLKLKFNINGKSFDDYKDLVYYITYKLDSGKYKLIYDINYRKEFLKLEQIVTIEEEN